MAVSPDPAGSSPSTGTGGSPGTTPGTTTPTTPTAPTDPLASGRETLRSTRDELVQRRKLDVANLLLLDGYFEGGRYERYQRLTVLSGTTASVRFYGYNLAGGGANRPLRQQRYSLLVDGVPLAQVEVAAGATEGRFSLDLTPLSDGWHELDVAGHSSETAAPWVFWLQRGTTPPAVAQVPVTTGTYGLLHGPVAGEYAHFQVRVPARFQPTELPLQPRDTPAFDTALTRADLVQVQWVPARRDDVFRPNRTRDGVITTSNRQPYFWSDLVERLPRLPLLDGPRGRGTLQMPTHLQIGRLGQIYFTDPWRVGKVATDGTVQTLAGYRHRAGLPTFWGSPPELELVGDWSAVPESRRGFHELWGMAWDERSLVVNEAAAPIGDEKPHLTGPRQFVADTQNNRVCLLEYAPASREQAPRVSEFIVGLSDPWDLVCSNGLLYVSERTAHRISVFDATTGRRVKTLLSGADLAGVNATTRFVFRRVALEQIRAQTCVAPEGLFLHDGWLYFGSRAMGLVKRVNLLSEVVETVVEPRLDDNANFIKLAVSDGSFGPKGTVFICTWSNNFFGYPPAYLPGGKQWEYLAGTSRGGPWGAAGYPSAVAVRMGRMACGSSAEGLLVQSRALPGDAALPANYAEGARDWERLGYHLTHGPGGFGYHGLPLPWGVSSAIDSYLRAHGHAR